MDEDPITRALALMREAITKLDQGRATVSACYLQMAIDHAEALQEARNKPSFL